MKNLTKQDWENHVTAAREHPEGIKSYCRAAGLSNASLHYWKKKLRTPRAFARVRVAPPDPKPVRAMPDPRWLAEFLLALGA